MLLANQNFKTFSAKQPSNSYMALSGKNLKSLQPPWVRRTFIQCLTTIPGRLLNSLWKWGHFDRAKSTLKILLASWTFKKILKGYRSLDAENLESVGQRAAKLLAIKLWEWFDPGTTRIRANWFERGQGRSAGFYLWPPTLTAGNFEALWPTDPKFSVLKDLNPFLKYSINSRGW